MAFTKVHHVKYTVADLDRSVAFYCDLLGFVLTYQADREGLPSYDTIMDMEDVKLRVGMLEHPESGFVIGLVEFKNPAPVIRDLKNNFVGASSLALQVMSARDTYDRLRAAGVPTLSGPTEIVREGKVAAVAFYILDPDKIPVEIWQPTSQ